MTGWVLLSLLASFALGSALQRTAGLGLALVAAPVLSLLLGPVVGVTVTNVGTVVSSALVMSQVWREIDWHRFARIGPLITVGSVPGALLVREVPLAWLDVVVGGSVLLGLLVTWLARDGAPVRGSAPAMLAGLAGGFMNTTAGVAGPAMVVYGLASRWEHRRMAATLAPIFLTAGLTSFVVKWVLGASQPAELLPWWVWPCVVAVITAGVWAGTWLTTRIDPRVARALTLAIAVTGSVLALARGLSGL